jgi:hypothetical protein
MKVVIINPENMLTSQLVGEPSLCYIEAGELNVCFNSSRERDVEVRIYKPG